MISQAAINRLQKIYYEAPTIALTDDDKFVIFSDLHLGNGGFNDDFAPNSELFIHILKNFYYQKNYKLILNGDIEELYKFPIKKIEKTWKRVYDIFDEFNLRDGLYKIFGNHDFELIIKHHNTRNYKLFQALRLNYKTDTIFIYHGHQTANKLEQYSKTVGYLVKYLFRAIGNKPVSYENGKKFETEKTAFYFSTQNKILSILGHTHRPLFESLSRLDSLKILIESLIRKYRNGKAKNKIKIESQIKRYIEELNKLYERNDIIDQRSSIYNNRIAVPCLFNSGAVTGKRGITAIEIKKGKIALVYWFDKKRSQRYLSYKDVLTKRYMKTDYYKAILRKNSLDYLFSRIKLLC